MTAHTAAQDRRRHGAPTLLLLLIPLLLRGCHAYEGDGEMKYAGPFAATDKYELRLGRVEPGTKTYRLKGLPKEEFVIGLVVRASAEAMQRCGPDDVAQVVTLRLENADGELVMDESAPLSDWVWSHSGQYCDARSFVYRRGEEKWTRLPDGGSGPEQLDLKAHEGWGSYFTPSRDTEFELSFTLHEELPEGITARLVATGGGWK